MNRLISIITSILFFGTSLFGINNVEDENKKEYNDIAYINVNEAMQPIKIVGEPLKKETQQEEETKEVKVEEPKKSKKELKIEEFETRLNNIEDIEDNKEWFLEYKELLFKYSEWVELPETVFDVFTEEEVNLICRMVETECYGQDFDPKVNVACVALNRLDSGKFGDTITEIITRPKPKQFAYGRTKISEDTILAVEYAFMFGDTTQGALFFHSMKKTETFNKRKYIFTDKAGHHFY